MLVNPNNPDTLSTSLHDVITSLFLIFKYFLAYIIYLLSLSSVVMFLILSYKFGSTKTSTKPIIIMYKIIQSIRDIFSLNFVFSFLYKGLKIHAKKYPNIIGDDTFKSFIKMKCKFNILNIFISKKSILSKRLIFISLSLFFIFKRDYYS